MDPVFAAIETSALSTWLRDSSPWAFPIVLVLHTWGLAFLVGACVAVDLRLLGVGGEVPLSSLDRYNRVMWAGFWVNAVSGVLLLVAYPTKALTNPLFYMKLALIAAGLVLARQIRRRLQPGDVRPPSEGAVFAWLSLCCWIAAIFAGRLLAYTHTRLLVDELA